MARGLLFLRVLACVVLAALVFVPLHDAKAAFDPNLRWYTIETEHFRISYYTGEEEVAQRVASTAESIYHRMTEALGYEPKGDKTEIQLVDNGESANGSAAALPYNALRLIITAPEDFSPLGDVDDWYLELVTHEFTHVLHTDHIRGIPALVNAVLGKTIAPNQIQPRWILEGYGVFEESARTSAGRLRNSMWEMFLRADMLEDNIAGLDEMSNIPRRWPQGNLFYLYGSSFVAWIAEKFGEEALRKVSYDYGGQLIPWGIQRSIRRATGKTYDELFPEWVASMKARYGAQATAVKKAGIRQGVRLTHHGQIARYPRWIPKGTWPEHEGAIMYYRDDQHIRTGLYALDINRDDKGNVLSADERHPDLVARTPIESVSSFTPDGDLIYSASEVDRNLFLYNDIERVPVGKKSQFGTGDGIRLMLTNPAVRATDPAVSPDGRRIVFTENHAGTRSIHIGDLEQDRIANIRPLVPTQWLEQAFTPRWSPDGTHVVYSVWKEGGYRDIRYVDVRAGTFREITNDRAVDGAPSFSADGRLIYFQSDRTGIANVYAYELASGKLSQVTNVINGAYCPEPSPDGKTLAYVGYTAKGFDLYAMRIDEDAWTEAAPYVDDHPPTPHVDYKRWPVKKYSPWHTLAPRRYGVAYTEGSWGHVVTIDATGSDISGLHTVSATSTVELDHPEFEGSISYTYGGLPFDASATVFRSIAPRGGYSFGPSYSPTIVQETAGFASTLAYTRGTAYDSRSYVITQSVSRVGFDIPKLPVGALDPYNTPSIPTGNIASTLHLGYSYSNAERYLWSVGPERGISFSYAIDLTDPLIGSDFAGFTTNGDFTWYLLMPWLEHHSLALHAGGGTSGGTFPGRGAFYVGSFVDLPVVDTIKDVLIQGGLTLRGYSPLAESGRSYALTNAEYRFPILNVDRGQSTLPIFLNRITGAAFLDYGSAFDDFRTANFKTGTGAELWFDVMLGYVETFTFRVGFARGLSSGGISHPYFVAAVPY